MEEILTLVDENDIEIGTETREKCHLRKGKMHRAISVFLFNNRNLMLIQQRSQKKLLWPGFWDCTVATHVYPHETYESSAERGLKQELGISAKVKRILAFTYFAPFGKHAENEYCALLIGRYGGDVTPFPSEVSSFDYVSLKKLKKNVAQKEDVYTPWFRIAMEKFLAHPASTRFW